MDPSQVKERKEEEKKKPASLSQNFLDYHKLEDSK